MKVIKTLELMPKRGEVHHLESRGNLSVRYDSRNGILLCAVDHEHVERHRLTISGTASMTFKKDGKKYWDADCALVFTKEKIG